MQISPTTNYFRKPSRALKSSINVLVDAQKQLPWSKNTRVMSTSITLPPNMIIKDLSHTKSNQTLWSVCQISQVKKKIKPCITTDSDSQARQEMVQNPSAIGTMKEKMRVYFSSTDIEKALLGICNAKSVKTS